jgi:hypothetical protein
LNWADAKAIATAANTRLLSVTEIKAIITANSSTALITGTDIYVAAENAKGATTAATGKDWVVIGVNSLTAGNAYVADNVDSGNLPAWDATGSNMAANVWVMVLRKSCYWTASGGTLIKASTYCKNSGSISNKLLDDTTFTAATAHDCHKKCQNTPWCRYFALGKSTSANQCSYFEEGCTTESSTLFDWYSISDYEEQLDNTTPACTHYEAYNYYSLVVTACKALNEANCGSDAKCYWTSSTAYLTDYTCIWSASGYTLNTHYWLADTTDMTKEACHNFCQKTSGCNTFVF